MGANVPIEIKAHAARIANSRAFGTSERLRELLQHTVAESLAGRGASLKESVLGVTVFGRKPGYDSGANSIVRVEFARLRRKLQKYYETEGASETLRIVFPKGCYAPEFVRTADPAEPAFTGSVVVLPFTCLGSDPDDDYFADGLTDELITALTRVAGLKVVARTSSFTFKGRANDIRGIGATLHVDTAIEGSMRRQGDVLRIHVQLVNVHDGCHLWAAKYERRLAGVFQLQEEIAAAIVVALKMQLPRHVQPKRAADPEAHALYLKGRYWWHRWNPGALRKAAGYFQQAIERDPAYAGAYSGLADCLFVQGFYGYGRPVDAMSRAQVLARNALQINPLLGEAHCSLGMIENAWEWNSRQSQTEFRRCLELHPSYAMAISKYATSYLSPICRLGEAAEWLERALALDPLSPFVHADYALNFVHRGLYEEFDRKAGVVLDDDPAMVKLYWFMAYSRAMRGNCSGAADTIEDALRQFPEDPTTLGNGAGVYAVCGNSARAAELRSKLEFLAQIRYVPKTALGFAYSAKGDEEAFFRIMQAAVAERDPMARTLRLVRQFLPVASDPRFDLLLSQVGLSDQHVAQEAAIDLAG